MMERMPTKMNWTASDIISIILALLNTILIPLVTVLIKKYRQNRDDMVLEKKGTQALLRNELLSLSHVYIKNGYVSYIEKCNFENMYTAYHNLGTNGAMTDIYNKVMALPVVDDQH